MTAVIRLASLVLALGLGLGASSLITACQVINPDHCANQALPGNVWCKNLSKSTPFCSPCVSAFHGCVAFEPVGCGDYDPAVLEGGDEEDESSGSGSGSGSGTAG